jgi:5-methylcytosine-specific restriction endonuclease McrA
MAADKVLLLNASFEPIRALGMTRAMVLLIQGKAEYIETVPDEFIYSAHDVYEKPSVIKLNYMVKIPFTAKVALNRRAVMARDAGICQYGCGRRATTIDHVHPRSKGGKHIWTNVVACCTKCNAKKADHLLENTHFKLMRPPTVPDSTIWLAKYAYDHPEWSDYLGVPAIA